MLSKVWTRLLETFVFGIICTFASEQSTLAAAYGEPPLRYPVIKVNQTMPAFKFPAIVTTSTTTTTTTPLPTTTTATPTPTETPTTTKPTTTVARCQYYGLSISA
jgi:hypothetical protein